MGRQAAIIAVVGLGTVLGPAAEECRGGYTGLQKVFVGEVSTAAGIRWVYRIYAMFNNPNDQVLLWGSQPGTPVTFISNGICSNPATPFFQAPGGGNTAPYQDAIDKNPDVRWDTFATIGVSIGDQGVPWDQTSLSIGFPMFINGPSLTLADKAVFTILNSPQAFAGFAGDGDPALRVLLMQLTVQPYTNVIGSIGEIWMKTAEGSYYTAYDQGWNFIEPLGFCCRPNGDCVLRDIAGCKNMNGYWIGCDGDCQACAGTCQADIVPPPGDGEVDVDDLLAVINSWGPCPPFTVCPPDIAPYEGGNNVVDIDDLLLVISSWGPCGK